ncbi:MAG: hypothetical protein JO053_07585 [Acidobacteria bacterium]|nr:hypothetical protein [Acidobacteriota bacterium]
MFCPNCGIDEKQPNQFCRACGTNLLQVRDAVEKPDSVTASAITAREEIGRAIAEKIKGIGTAKELKKVAEDVLPEVEKFLESPEEKKLRRIRVGTLLSAIGLGVAVALSILAVVSRKEDALFLASLGGVCFFLGLGFVVNAILFTVPRKKVADESSHAAAQRALDANTADLSLPEAPARPFASVIENTTTHLDEKEPLKRR